MYNIFNEVLKTITDGLQYSQKKSNNTVPKNICELENKNKEENNKNEENQLIKNEYKLMDIGNDAIIIVASYIHGDRNIHNFISACKNNYLLKKYISFYGYYPICLNLNLPFKSVSAKISSAYNKELPKYITRLEIVDSLPQNIFNVEDVIINVSMSRDRISTTKDKITFGNKLKRLYFNRCPREININLKNCDNLNFIGFSTNLLKNIPHYNVFLQKMAGSIGNFVAIDGSKKKNPRGVSTIPTGTVPTPILPNNVTPTNVQDDDDDDDDDDDNDDEDNDQNGNINGTPQKVYKLNINKMKLNKYQITKLYLYLNDIEFKIKDVNNFISHFPNLKELIIDGQYKHYNKNGNYTFNLCDLLNDEDMLYIPEGVKVCKIVPQLLIKNYPKSLERLYLKNYIPINCEVEERIKIIKLDYIDDKLLR